MIDRVRDSPHGGSDAVRGAGAAGSADVAQLTRRLAAAGVPTPEVDARLLVRHLPPERLADAIARRADREPLQLILGSVGFRYLELTVRPGVFIPRPETEVLAGEAIARTPEGGTVVEPCTGAGAIAIAVATESAAGVVHASDVSPEAVALARSNAAAAGARLTLHCGDLLDPLPESLRGTVDVLVANPPYVAAAETAELPPEVAGWDPPGALVPGPTGHEATDRLIVAAVTWLRPGGWLLLETAAARAELTAIRAAEAGLVATNVKPDLTGRPRVVVAQRRARGTPAGLGSAP